MVTQSIPLPPLARRAVIILMLGAAGIGFAPIFVRLSELGPAATAFYRLALALPVMALWLGLERRADPATARPGGTDRLHLLAAGLFFAGDLALWHWSIAFTTVANATLLANFAPIFVTIGAWALLGHRPTRRFLGALALSMGGAVCLMGSSLTFDLSHVWGDALGIGCSVFYAGYLLMVSRLRARFSTATIMLWSGIGTAVPLLPLAALSGEVLMPLTLSGWGVLLGLALVSHIGGQGLIAAGLAHLPPAFGSMVLLVQPAVAALLAWLLLDESLSPWQVVGAGAIIAGIRLARR